MQDEVSITASRVSVPVHTRTNVQRATFTLAHERHAATAATAARHSRTWSCSCAPSRRPRRAGR